MKKNSVKKAFILTVALATAMSVSQLAVKRKRKFLIRLSLVGRGRKLLLQRRHLHSSQKDGHIL